MGEFICAILGCLVVWASIPLICRHFTFLARSETAQFHHTHRVPVPRLGGLALAFAFVIVSLLAFAVGRGAERGADLRWVVIESSLAMFLMGFWDDISPLGARKKLFLQILISWFACYGGIEIQSFRIPGNDVVLHFGAWSPVITVAWFVVLTNLVNLIDGIDGLAGGISLMLMALLWYTGAGLEMTFPAMCAAGMAGALIGFLRFNFPPARIYLGDGGAYFLGFLIAALSAVNSHKGTVVAALTAPLFVLALPIIDVSLAILRRGLKGLPLFRPDRRHIHHRLLEAGLTRTQVVVGLYVVSLIFLLMGFMVFWTKGRMAPILFGVLCLILAIATRIVKFSREWWAVGRVLGKSLEMRKTTQYALTLSRWLELEAERAESVAELWDDFQFMAAKLGFSRVSLILADGCQNSNTEDPAVAPGIMHAYRHEMNLGEFTALDFSAGPDEMEPKLFEHLCDIASEAWHKAAVRWSAANDLPIRFTSRRQTPEPEPGSGRMLGTFRDALPEAE